MLWYLVSLSNNNHNEDIVCWALCHSHCWMSSFSNGQLTFQNHINIPAYQCKNETKRNNNASSQLHTLISKYMKRMKNKNKNNGKMKRKKKCRQRMRERDSLWVSNSGTCNSRRYATMHWIYLFNIELNSYSSLLLLLLFFRCILLLAVDSHIKEATAHSNKQSELSKWNVNSNWNWSERAEERTKAEIFKWECLNKQNTTHEMQLLKCLDAWIRRCSFHFHAKKRQLKIILKVASRSPKNMRINETKRKF